MMLNAPVGLRTFPPLFERLIYYALLPDLFSRVVLEAGLGIYWYTLIQPKLWVFYILVAIEFLFQIGTLVKAKFRIGLSLLAALLFLVMIIHGLLVALAWQNNPSKIATDTIPIFVSFINIILLSNAKAFENFKFGRLALAVHIYSVLMVVVGILAVSAGRPSIVNLGGAAGGPMAIGIMLVSLAIKKDLDLRAVLLVMLIVAPTVPNMTRTGLVSFLLIFSIYVLPKVFQSGKALYVSTVSIALLIVSIPLVLPEDSPLMRRIDGTFAYDPNKKTGSLGERQLEQEAIDKTLEERGPAAEWFGLGAGGTYIVVYDDGTIPENYSHAHFSWALFKLRFGYIGYFYLACFVTLLLINIKICSSNRTPENMIICNLGLWGIFFLFTYAVFHFLIAGLQFSQGFSKAMPAPSPAKKREAAPSLLKRRAKWAIEQDAGAPRDALPGLLPAMPVHYDAAAAAAPPMRRAKAGNPSGLK